jgi:uncharacterized membrane protein
MKKYIIAGFVFPWSIFVGALVFAQKILDAIAHMFGGCAGHF